LGLYESKALTNSPQGRNNMKTLLEICGTVLVAFFLFVAFYIKYEEKELENNDIYPGKITIHLSSGEKLHPSRAHVRPEHVQVIMPDGTAITMAWKQVDSISHQ
jgi:hypothetical protein